MTISPFTNHLPVKIQFGEGAALRLPALLQDTGSDRVAVVLDEGIEQCNPAAARVVDALRASAMDVVLVRKPAGEPTFAMVDATSARIREVAAGALVALGGGSVIDTAKAARLCVQLGCAFGEFLASPMSYPVPDTPLIAVPTTAGTGSEVSGGSVVSDREKSRKSGIADPSMRPQYAVVDPRLTWSMPPAMTAHTGIDALAQAIAAMVARVRTPIGDAIAVEAVRLIGGSLNAAYQDGDNRVARSNMACGSMMAGLAMNISDCTAEHSLGQAIGGLTGAAHGLTVGLVLAETLDRERRHVPDQLERVADALAAPRDGTGDGSRAVTRIRNLLAGLDFPVMGSLGITEQDLGRLTDLAMADYFLTMSPRPWSSREVRGAFTQALALRSRRPAVAGQ